jgi:hypothetical protein
MAVDPQNLKKLPSKIFAWLTTNPLHAGLVGAAVLVIALFAILVVSIERTHVTQEKVQIAEDDPNLCRRVRKLDALEPSLAKRGQSKEYQAASAKAFKQLTGTEASPDDLAILSHAAESCDGADNDSFAWAVLLDARIKRGVWPAQPQHPPKRAEQRTRLAQAIEKNPGLPIVLPADAAARKEWLQLAATAQPPLDAVIQRFRNGTQEADLAIYQQLVEVAPDSPPVAQFYEKLGLLSQPIDVADTAGGAANPPASMPVGPNGTLPFLGVLGGEQCALAGAKSAYPPLVIRSCKGLVPRRLPQGEVVLVGAEVRLAGGAALHWLPLVLSDDGRVSINARDKVDDKLLAAFVSAAPHFTADGKPYAGELKPLTVEGKPLTFVSPLQKIAPVIFSTAKARIEKKDCPKLDKLRCEALGGDDHDKCEIAAPVCVVLNSGAKLRVARSLQIHAEPCLREFGEKSSCEHHDTYGLFVDKKDKGDKSYSENAPVVIAESAGASD